MSQAGYTPIQLYHSTTAAAAPSAGNLANGELAVNITDGKLYYKDNGGVVQVLASKAGNVNVSSFSAGTTGFTPNTATTGAVTLAGTLATTNGGTGLTSFTANGVVYASSSSALTTGSALTFDGSRLSVAGTSPSIRIDDTDASGAFGIDWYYSGAGGVTRANITLNSTGEMQFQAGASGSSGWYQTFVLSGSEQMRLTSTGLGIGTSSPSNKLVVSNGGANGLEVNPTSGVSSGASLNGYNRSTSAFTPLTYTALSHHFQVGSSPATAATLDSSGNLGIGTSSPVSKLQSVSAVSALTSNAGFSSLPVTVSDSTALAADTGGGINFNAIVTAGGVYNSIAAIKAGRSFATGFDYRGYLSFYTGSNATGHPVENMRLDSSGNLGIGTSSPSRKLTVFGSDGVPFFNVNGYDVASWTGATLDFGGMTAAQWNTLRFFTSGSERMRLDSSGNLGIGTSSPSAKLNVVGTGDMSGIFESTGASNAASVIMRSGSGTTSGLYAYARFVNNDTNAQDWRIGTYGNNNLSIVNAKASTTPVVLDTSGNLGLGVTPSAWESTAKAFQFGSLGYVARGSSGQTMLGYNNYLNTSNQYIYSATSQASRYEQISGEHRWHTAASGTAGNVISFTQAMTLDANGALLIGQSSWSFSSNGTQIAASGRIFNTSNTDYNFELAGSTSARIRFYSSAGGSGTTVGNITVDTTNTQYNTSSDYRLKNIAGPVANSGAYIDSLRPVEGTWKIDGSAFVGLIAHEVQEASRTNVATGVKDGPEMQAMDYSSAEIIANLIAELQSLRKRVAQLEGTQP